MKNKMVPIVNNSIEDDYIQAQLIKKIFDILISKRLMTTTQLNQIKKDLGITKW